MICKYVRPSKVADCEGCTKGFAAGYYKATASNVVCMTEYTTTGGTATEGTVQSQCADV